MPSWTLTIDPSLAGQRLDQLLAAQQPDAGSRSAWQRSIAAGLVRVNSVVVRSSHYRIKVGDQVAAQPMIPSASALAAEDIPLTVVYEDDALLVVNKPAGLVVHPAPGHPSGTLVNALLHYTQQLSSVGGAERPGIVHRLDRDTSGLLLVAKTEGAHRLLAKQFHDRTVHRMYLAVVKGRMQQERGDIHLPVGRSRMDRQKMGVRWEIAREAITQYQVRQFLDGATLVALYPITGRTHQLRVHMAYLGHPILGDQSYGGGASSLGIHRQMLHAMSLGFVHPVTGRTLEVQAPLPDEMLQAIERLGGSSAVMGGVE